MGDLTAFQCVDFHPKVCFGMSIIVSCISCGSCSMEYSTDDSSIGDLTAILFILLLPAAWTLLQLLNLRLHPVPAEPPVAALARRRLRGAANPLDTLCTSREVVKLQSVVHYRPSTPIVCISQSASTNLVASYCCREVAEQYRQVWARDRVSNLVVRLRQNVLRAGLARIGAAYSRISLANVASKLGVASAVDAESIVAKVIRCGTLGAPTGAGVAASCFCGSPWGSLSTSARQFQWRSR